MQPADTAESPTTLAQLAADRGLFLKDLGPASTVSLYNRGHALPGPHGLRRMAQKLGLEPQTIMAICRAAVARRASAKGRKAVRK